MSDYEVELETLLEEIEEYDTGLECSEARAGENNAAARLAPGREDSY